MNISRTLNSAKNMSVSFIMQIIGLGISFLSRTIFITYLGKEYLGLNGLFSNILSLLSFAELGIGSAIVYSMYKPISESDNLKISALMNLYNKAYKIVAIIITIVGIILIPFLRYIITEIPDISENIILIYLLFVANTVVSYIFSYKKSIITADQKDYIVVIYNQIFHIMQIIVQTIILIYTKNYILYLLIQIIFTIFNNIAIAIKSNQLYPYINENKSAKLSKEDTIDIFNNIKSIFLYKIGSVILTGTDNIIISSIIGISAIGMSSNYILIINSINAIISKVLNSITGSIGNLNAENNLENKYLVFEELFLITYWIFSFCSIGLILLLNELINLWIGKEYLLSMNVVISLVIVFYITGVNFVPSTYRMTMGIFTKAKYTPIIASVLNIILSILLGKKLGLAGIFIATAIARSITFNIIDPILVFRIGFSKGVLNYFIKYYAYIFLMAINCIITNYCLNIIYIEGVIGFIFKIGVVIIVSNFILLITFYNSNVFKRTINRILRVFKIKF